MKKIGVWGFGAVGKSAVSYLHTQGQSIQVLDNRILTTPEQDYLKAHNIPWFSESEIIHFLEHNECIVPSPGVNLTSYMHYRHKWISELDLFYQAFKKPIIAITGTIGKTSVTHLLSSLLQETGFVTGGNIGTPMLTLLDKEAQGAILELSSFQLSLCKQFAPDLALWTNLHPNHLDRHTTLEDYIDAKYKIIAHQQAHQTAIVPTSLLTEIKKRGLPKSSLICFSPNMPSLDELNAGFQDGIEFIYPDKEVLILHTATMRKPLIALHDLPTISFIENWILITCALYALELPIAATLARANACTLPDHRLRTIATINNVAFLNDSKSTTPLSTIAAVDTLKQTPIHLFLGGLSKGIDRAPLIKHLRTKIHHVYCFGKEAELLAALCKEYNVSHCASATLEQAFSACIQKIRPGDSVLFSPSGSSFDLFENYEQRGNRFIALVEQYAKMQKNRHV